jgi:excisionase family DNA binding protein
MPVPETQPGHGIQQEEVLTLSEAASYLRVSEDTLLAHVTDHAIPARKIGGEWRFLKRALADWLRYGHLFDRKFNGFPPPWMLEYPEIEKLLFVLGKRLLSRLATIEATTGKRGSKQAVLKHFAVFKDDPGIEGMLTDIYSRREADEE